jgi:hypothetical protein
MKNQLLLFFIVVHFSPNVAQSLYDLNKIQEIKITFPYSNWDQKLDSLHAADTDARLIATIVELNGVIFDSVGIRYKGNSTYNAARNKNPLNIKLDYVKSSQKYDGYNTLKLSNGFMDPSFLREVMGYKIARQYLPASQANFINVYVNNVLIGLYTNVQDVDKDFLSNHYYSSSNAFFQCDRTDKQVTLPGTCPSGMGSGSALKYVSADSACYYNNYEQESDAGWSQLLRMMFTLNSDVSQIEKYLDVDRALWMLAINNFYVNLDSYTGSGHNYLVYENNSGRFNSILWDLNEFYGSFANAGTGPQLTVAQMQQLDPLLHINNAERPLISKLFSNSKWKKRYLAHLYTVLTEAKNSNGYEQDGLALQNLISTSVTNDVNKFFSNAGFTTNLYNDFTNSGGMGNKTYPGLISFTNARIAFLTNHAAINVTKPLIENVTSLPSEVHKNDLITILAKISNAGVYKLFYRFDKEDVFIETDLSDDGLHQDGTAGDGIYGAQVNIRQNQEMQYYIYAENANIATLSPARAEYEFYTIHVKTNTFTPGEILLNEVMSSNTSYLMDESGEFDDWFELYNTTDRDISCYGLFATDNPDNKLKWEFPDTVIKAKSYLSVWADEDGKDPGLHANFKLSKSGEKILLYTSDSVLLDQVEFPALNDNQSYGICNGLWKFTKSPTFAKKNDCLTTNSHDAGAIELFNIQPNPFEQKVRIIFNARFPVSLLISDAIGRPVFSNQHINTSELELNTSQWIPGIYFMNADFENRHESKIIIKH